MVEDLKSLLRSTEGERPSPEFVANLRELIIDEAATKIAAIDGEVVDIGRWHEPPSETATSSRWKALALTAAASLLLLGGFALIARGRGDDQLQTVVQPEESTAATPAATSSVAQPSPVAPLSGQDSFADEGTYTVGEFGVPFTFTTEEPLWIKDGDGGAVTLAHPSARGNDDRSLAVMRLSALSDPADPTAPFDSVTDGWPATDFTGWLENLPETIVVADLRATTVGGFEAVRADLDLSALRCDEGPQCAYFGTNRMVYTQALLSGSSYRIWVVELGAEAPLALIAGIRGESQLGWLDNIDQLVATITFGDIAPNPIAVVPTGRVELPLLGGASVELARASVFFEDGRGFDRITIPGALAGTDFLVNPFARNGSPLSSIDELLEHLRQWNVELTELEPTTIGGQPARAFDYTGSSSRVELKLTNDASRGWAVPSIGRLWVVEHPQRGLLLVAAGADGPSEDRLAEAVADAEAVVETLEFIEME